MRQLFKSAAKKNEYYILITIIIICCLVEVRSGQFFTPNNIVDLIAAMIVPGLFALGTFLVILSGGIDVSFPALASLSAYITTRVLLDNDYTGSIWLAIVLSLVLGAIFGALNGFLIAKFKFPALIVTLGTQSVFRGLLQGTLNAVQIYKLPEPMEKFGYDALFITQNPVSMLTSKMPITVIVLIIAIIIVFLLLKFTIFGRGIYAVGGSEASAERAGFNVFWIKMFVYILAGILASLAGLIRTCMIAQFHPTNMLGMEMMIIASVVLGGAAITGGRGTLAGAMLGTVLIVIVQNSLILIGIPTFWQGFFLGLLILVGTGISAVQVSRNSSKLTGLKDFGEVKS